jgi:glyoxylase-like metal-dependent hydrolase (beta-lactamase superfamily II)
MEVAPGVHQFQLPFPDEPSEHVNIYLVQGKEGALLVDTGWNTPENFAILEGGIEELGLGWGNISQIVVTHIHPDHYGLAGKIKQLSPARLAMHRIEKDLIKTWYIDKEGFLRSARASLCSNGMPVEHLPQPQEESWRAELEVLNSVAPVQPDFVLHGGEEISSGGFHFRVLWTPGHSPGHICLYEPQRKLLFSGDHILPITTPNVGYLPWLSTNPLNDYLDSLSKMKGLDVDLILPGHEHVFQGLRRRIEELFEHHRERKAAITERIKEEPKNAYKIASEIPWIPEKGGVDWQYLSSQDKQLAVMETASHLESLQIEWKVRKIPRDDIILYLRI